MTGQEVDRCGEKEEKVWAIERAGLQTRDRVQAVREGLAGMERGGAKRTAELGEARGRGGRNWEGGGW